MTKKAYLLTIGAVQYALHLSSDYDGIKDVAGLSDMPSPVPDGIVDETEVSIARKGKVTRVSVGLKSKKRRRIIVSSTKPIKALIGKTLGDDTIVSASVVQHMRLG